MSAGVATIELDSGTLGYRDRGSGPTLLLLHSLGIPGWLWDGVIEALADHYRIIAPDFPGYGDSPRPSHSWMMEDYAEAVLTLGEKLSVKSWHVVGNSFGSLVALEVAAGAVPRPLSLSLLGLPIWPDAKGRREWLHSRTEVLLPDGSSPPATLETAAALIPSPTEELVEKMNADRANTGSWYLQTMWALAAYDPAPRLRSLDLPTLIAYGESDPFKGGMAVAGELAENAETAEIEGGGHFAPLDQPRAVADALAKFIGDGASG